MFPSFVVGTEETNPIGGGNGGGDGGGGNGVFGSLAGADFGLDGDGIFFG